MNNPSHKPLSLFQGFGVEMEYMIVDRETLKILPIADQLLEEMAGNVTADYENGSMAWSNELVLHVIEIKTNGPANTLKGLDQAFAENVELANQRLAKHNAILLPGGAHPFMDPLKETKIWPHEYNEVYELYDSIFGCKGHGWSNLQSTHINLPFANDQEFERLHAAIRLVLPIIPALTASTPILDRKYGGFKDHRLEYYRKNQQKIPSIAGQIIPERAFSQAKYEELIFGPIKQAIAPYDKRNVLSKYFLNSRGAIARFDRMAIEIRIIDIQECPAMDIAILELIVSAIRMLINETHVSLEQQKAWDEERLFELLKKCIIDAEDTQIDSTEYLSLFGLDKGSYSGMEIWKHLAKSASIASEPLTTYFEEGSLSSRILKAVDKDFSDQNLLKVYSKLAGCLATNTPFKTA